MQVLGIDPGATGAIALVQSGPGNPLALTWDMPTIERTVNKRTRHVLNPVALFDLIRDRVTINKTYDLSAVLEYVGPMPGEGVHSAAVFGRYLGYCEMALVAAGLPWEFVSPQKWKREFGLLGQPKDAARAVAGRLFPTVDLSLKKHIGRADALLIAEWERRQLAARSGAAA